jgi:hypothetical protein
MTPGHPPLAAIRDAKKFAEKMGYQWEENTHPELGYHLLIFKPDSLRLITVRVVRHAIGADVFYDELLPDEIAGMRMLPFPAWIPREIWLRTQHERTFRRLLVHEFSIGEIGFWNPDGYVNPHAKD